MVSWIFVLALTAAMAAMGGRAIHKRLRRRAAAASPGRSAESPMRVESFRRLDAEVDAARCGCGGRLVRLGEGGRTTELGELRVVRCSCDACEDDVDFFFVVSETRH